MMTRDLFAVASFVYDTVQSFLGADVGIFSRPFCDEVMNC